MPNTLKDLQIHITHPLYLRLWQGIIERESRVCLKNSATESKPWLKNHICHMPLITSQFNSSRINQNKGKWSCLTKYLKKFILYDSFIIQQLIHNYCTIWIKRGVRWPKIILIILQEQVILGGMEDTHLKSRNNLKIPHSIWISLDPAATQTAILRSTKVSIDLRRTLRLWSWF